MELKLAQADMRDGYFFGIPGVLVSSLVWINAAICAQFFSTNHVILIFFGGGMLIHPLSIVVDKLLGRRGAHLASNPLRFLAMETTVWLIAALPLVYGVSLANIQWFFPAMMVVIGTRYLAFSTLYGMRFYWLLGASLLVAAYICVSMKATFAQGAAIGGALECVFAVGGFLWVRGNRYAATTQA